MLVLKVVFGCVYLLICIATVIIVLLQESKSDGISAVTGGSDTFFGKNRSKSKEARLNSFTIVLGIAFAIFAIVLGALMRIDLNI